jgi:hypothetical protein|tara:strand:- start:281 stop:547 length:267 start_codon:yes stop_codon:yes gene_type:complete
MTKKVKPTGRRKKKKPLPKQYKAPAGSKREKLMRRAARLYKSGNKQAAFKLREEMEKKERAKKNKTKSKAKVKKVKRSRKPKKKGSKK